MPINILPFNQSSLDVTNSKVRLRRVDNMPIKHRVNLNVDIILGHDNLLRDISNLDLDIDLCQLLSDRVNLCQTGIDNLIEFAKASNETDGALCDGLVRVGAADTAGDGSESADNVSGGVHDTAVNAVVLIIRGELCCGMCDMKDMKNRVTMCGTKETLNFM